MGVWDSNHLAGCCEFPVADGTLSHNGSFTSLASALPSLPGLPEDNTIRDLGGWKWRCSHHGRATHQESWSYLLPCGKAHEASAKAQCCSASSIAFQSCRPGFLGVYCFPSLDHSTLVSFQCWFVDRLTCVYEWKNWAETDGEKKGPWVLANGMRWQGTTDPF